MRITIILLMLALCASVQGLRINEVMYNPVEETTGEFVELYGSLNVTNLTIGDDARNSTLTPVRIHTGNFTLILADGFNHSGINATIYVSDSKLGNGLANGGDTIYVYDNNTQILNFTYTGDETENGYSLEYYNGTYRQSLPLNGTPGLPNSEEIETTNLSYMNNSMNISESNSSETSVCNVTLKLEIEKTFYKSGEKIIYDNEVEGTDNFTIEYGITDIFGNVVKEFRNTTNENDKQYTPDSELPVEAYYVQNRLVSGACDNETQQNKALIVIEGTENSCSEEVVCEERIDEINELKNEVKKLRSKSCPSGGSGGGSSYLLPEKAGIKSFYTLKKKFDPVIKLFSRIEGEGIYKVSLESQVEEFNKTVVLNGSETFEFEVNAERGKNLYIIQLSEKGEILDTKKASVEFEEVEEVEQVVETEPPEKEDPPEPEETETVINPPAATARVAYDSGGNAAPWLIAVSVLITLITGGYSLWAYYKASFIKEDKLLKDHGQEGNSGKARKRLDTYKRDV